MIITELELGASVQKGIPASSGWKSFHFFFAFASENWRWLLRGASSGHKQSHKTFHTNNNLTKKTHHIIRTWWSHYKEISPWKSAMNHPSKKVPWIIEVLTKSELKNKLVKVQVTEATGTTGIKIARLN
jgi:hypothetical protein